MASDMRCSVLGLFAETFLDSVPELNAGLPPRIRLGRRAISCSVIPRKLIHLDSPLADVNDKSFFTIGKWLKGMAPGTYGSSYAFTEAGKNNQQTAQL